MKAKDFEDLMDYEVYDELKKLKRLYLDEIKKINKKDGLVPADHETSAKALEVFERINKLCCDKECREEEETAWSERGSMRYPYRSMMQEPLYPESQRMYPQPWSERRGRDSMGRYVSRCGSDHTNRTIEKLEKMADEAPDETTRRAIETAIRTLEDHH